MAQNVSRATLGRLPMYLEYLKSLSTDRYPNVSATIIARALGLGEVQVRKDLSSVSGEGKPKTGYVTEELTAKIESYLGQGEHTKAVIIGAGKLGRALFDYEGFSKYGMDIVAAFDSDPEKLGTGHRGCPILPLSELQSFCDEHNVRIGVITVPGEYAQDVCDRLVGCGIDAIWSFAPFNLTVPDGVLLRQENLALSLAYLNEQIRDK